MPSTSGFQIYILIYRMVLNIDNPTTFSTNFIGIYLTWSSSASKIDNVRLK
jgi:hypothetical protein